MGFVLCVFYGVVYRLRITEKLSPGGTDTDMSLLTCLDGNGRKSEVCRMGLSLFVEVMFMLTLMGIEKVVPVPGIYSLLSCFFHPAVNLQIH